MAINYYLDLVTKDIVFQQNNIRLTSTNTEFVSQKIENNLLIFLGEWWLDRSRGMPYISRTDRDDPQQNIFVKNPDFDFIDDAIINTVLSVEGVEEISNYSSSLENRTLKVSFDFQVTTGEIVPFGLEV